MKKPKCSRCGRIESNSHHVHYGADVENPVKHEFEPPAPQPARVRISREDIYEFARWWEDSSVGMGLQEAIEKRLKVHGIEVE